MWYGIFANFFFYFLEIGSSKQADFSEFIFGNATPKTPSNNLTNDAETKEIYWILHIFKTCNWQADFGFRTVTYKNLFHGLRKCLKDLDFW